MLTLFTDKSTNVIRHTFNNGVSVTMLKSYSYVTLSIHLDIDATVTMLKSHSYVTLSVDVTKKNYRK